MLHFLIFFFFLCGFVFFGSNFLFCIGIPADGIIPFQMETTSGEKKGLDHPVKSMQQKEIAISWQTGV